MGQKELREKMASEQLRQLRQRVVVNCNLEAFSIADTYEYIQHRIDVAGLPGVQLFAIDAIERIHEFSGGVPRLINAACDRCLLAEFAKRNGIVSVETSQAVLTEFARLNAPSPQPSPTYRPDYGTVVAR